MKLMRVVLENGGFQVSEATDAETGINMARKEPPDLIIMDVQLPGLDGLSATSLLKKTPRFQNIPIIAVTSYAMPSDDIKAMNAGCNGYIPKPINTRTFVDTINSYLNVNRP